MKIKMRMLNGPSDWGWIKSRISVLRVEDTCGIVAIDTEKRETVGAVVFDNFLSDSCQASIILETPILLRHGFLEECFDFVFNGVGKSYIYCSVARNNRASIRLCRKLGGIEKMVIPNGFRKGIDFVVFELHKSRSKFYQEIKKVA